MIFDIGGVIVPLRFQRALEEMSSLCGLPPREVSARMIAGRAAVRYECGELDDQAFTESVCSALDVNLDPARFRRVWCNIFDVEPMIPVPFFETLRRTYRMVLLSNTNGMHAERLRRECPAIPCFDDAVFSFETGCMKPDRRIFEEAIRRAGCAAGECFYTDDNPAYAAAANWALQQLQA